jgi:hypothetical protein
VSAHARASPRSGGAARAASAKAGPRPPRGRSPQPKRTRPSRRGPRRGPSSSAFSTGDWSPKGGRPGSLPNDRPELHRRCANGTSMTPPHGASEPADLQAKNANAPHRGLFVRRTELLRLFAFFTQLMVPSEGPAAANLRIQRGPEQQRTPGHYPRQGTIMAPSGPSQGRQKALIYKKTAIANLISFLGSTNRPFASTTGTTHATKRSRGDSAHGSESSITEPPAEPRRRPRTPQREPVQAGGPHSRIARSMAASMPVKTRRWSG